MSDSIIDGLLGQLQGAPIGQITQQLGIDPATAQHAVAAALPMLVGALGHNTQAPGGAGALLQALQDHSGQNSLGGLLGSLTGGGQGQSGGLGEMVGSVLGGLTGGKQGGGGLGGLLGAVLGGGGEPTNPQLNTGGILGHIFGGAQSHAQASLGEAIGLNSGKAGQLLAILAPIVMSYVASHASANNLDAAGLSTALGQERDSVQNQGGVAGDLLGAVLGRISDGSR